MPVNVRNGLVLRNNKWVNHKPTSSSVKLLILNLMPTKETTEYQFIRAFNKLHQNIDITFAYVTHHHFKTVSKDVIANNYVDLKQIKNNYYDGLIITGAPVEKLRFDQVDYWNEFKKIIDWSKSHVKQCLFECWAAQGALYYDFGIKKHNLSHKLFGVYSANYVNKSNPLTDFKDKYLMPQSRNSKSLIHNTNSDLQILVSNAVAGPMVVYSSINHHTYIMGHPEYTRYTLLKEYKRDLTKGININKPAHYLDKKDIPIYSWEKSSEQFYNNWINLIK